MHTLYLAQTVQQLNNANQFVDSFFSLIVGLIVAIFWLCFAISVTGNVKKTRIEAEKQTKLLEQIARANQTPASPPKIGEPAARKASSIEYAGLR